MKLFQLNFIGILILLLVLVVGIFVPSVIIQNIWNACHHGNLEQNIQIEVWQAALLWGAIVTALQMFGVFSFKFNFTSLEGIDIDSIKDPELREELEKLKQEAAAKKDHDLSD